MGKSKKPEKVLSEITDRVLRYWFIDMTLKKVHHVDEYRGRGAMIAYDHETELIHTDDNNSFKIYFTYKEATLVLYAILLEEKRLEWQECVDQSLELSKEITDILDKIDKLKDCRSEEL